ncbi:delta-type opioid receptor-like [Patiria miniata]|uniref:G-protein coupled receptors family 1 profile domain-containing protein n=1 Tax=Patiria miniata TaxID=46514 RepID=A0A913ZUY2_PATMI|nr:delta-type opioid receptor-like [Patiria miniata]
MARELYTPDTIVNLTSESDALLYTYSYTETVVLTVINPLILIVGLFGNFAFHFMIVRVRRMWTDINIYLASLSVTAVVLLVVRVSSSLARYKASPVPGDSISFGPAGCTAVFLLIDICDWASFAFAATVMNVLYLATCRPHLFRRLRGKKRAGITTACVWIVSIGIGLCFLPAWWDFVWYGLMWPDQERYQDYPELIGVCSTSVDWLIITHDLIQSTMFFISAVASFVIFLVILITLRKQFQSVGPSPGADAGYRQRATTQTTKRRKDRSRVARMIAMTTLAFFVLPMPYECTVFARSIVKLTGNSVLNDEQYKDLLFASTTLMNVTPAICPYIYVLSNPGYRSALVEAFTKKCGSRNSRFVVRGGEMSTLAK